MARLGTPISGQFGNKIHASVRLACLSERVRVYIIS